MSHASVSGVVLREPAPTPAGLRKGVVLCNFPERVLQLVPGLDEKCWVVERRGWCGGSRTRKADVILVDDIPAQVAWDRRLGMYSWLSKRLVPGARKAQRVWFGNADFVDTERFKPRGRAKAYDAIMIARWDAWKRHDLYVAAIRALRRRDPCARAVLLGHFDDASRQARAYRDQIIDEIRRDDLPIELPFLDAGTDNSAVDDVHEWIDASRTGLVLSKTEAINRSKLECLASDVPVIICSDACWCLRKHVTPTSGLIVPPDPDAIAGAILRVKQAESLTPRRYLLEHSGQRRAMAALQDAIDRLDREQGYAPAPLIPYDGRNETLIWNGFVEDLQRLLPGWP